MVGDAIVACSLIDSGFFLRVLQVFQRRKDGSVGFYRNFAEYATGFGNPAGEFWLGSIDCHLS